MFEPDDYKNKILDLTSQADEGGEGPAYICDHCEIPMQQAEEDLVSANNKNEILIRTGQHYCSKCGTVLDPSLSDQHQRVMKSVERSGPVIPKPSDNDAFFESIPSNTGLKPKHHKEFDPEPNERERLEAEGCTVLEERITTADGRTIVKRHY
jgi:hypothetical protein